MHCPILITIRDAFRNDDDIKNNVGLVCNIFVDIL